MSLVASEENYRPDIDALRAISVLAVIIYHAEIKIGNFYIFQGGFIGVDIFFVISGYLIASILNSKKISLPTFYERRARRIIPMLILIFFCFSILSWIYLLPIHLVDFANSMISAIFFISNLFFWAIGEQYGAQSSNYIPLLHTWSLGIEAQFYLFFPILLLFLIKYFKNYNKIVLVIFFILSIILSEYLSRRAPALNFYFFPSRFWEFLIGAFCFWISHEKNFNIKQYKNINYLLFFSIASIFVCFFLFNNTSRIPSFLTLLPIMGTMTIILFNDRKYILSNIFYNKQLVFVGKISYSLYLWHYPIFAFSKYSGFINDSHNIGIFTKKIFLIFIIFLLSVISYFLIENIFRDSRKISTKKFYFTIFFSTLILILFSTIVILKEGFKKRFPDIFHSDKIIKKNIFFISNQCMDKERKVCIFNKNAKNGSLVVIGDSHMQSMQNILTKFSVKNDFSLTYAISFGQKDFFFRENKIKNAESEILEKILKETIQLKKNIIIIGGRWSLWLKDAKNSDHKKNLIKDYINNLLESGNKIIIIHPIPEPGFDVLKKLNEYYKKNKNRPKYVFTIPFQDYLNKHKISNDFLNNFKDKNIVHVYPHKIFCNSLVPDHCVIHDDKHLFYDDDNHLSLFGIQMLSPDIFNAIQKLDSEK